VTTRVVVTGIGALTPVGLDAPSTWANLLEGQSGVARITLFDPSPYPIQIAGEVKGFNPEEHFDRKELRHLDRNVQLAVVAARQAARDAQLRADGDAVGVIFGSAAGGAGTLIEQVKILEERGYRKLSPYFLPHMLADSASGQIAIDLGLRGPNMAIVSACATGGHALGEAWETIRRGDAEAAVAGGCEGSVLPIFLGGFIAMRALAEHPDPTKASRPFDAARNGFVLAEGAAALVLERLDRAQARGAKIYAEMVGYGSSNDAFHMAAPREGGTGPAACMRMALRKADLPPEEVDYVNAHGTGTPLNDKFETVALKDVFGAHAKSLLVSSTKSMTGHMMGAAGATEAMVCVLALRDQVVPPTINLDTPDPECDLDYVPHQARKAAVEVALSNSMGLGGHNSSVVFRRLVDD
jgi:beta-ketoacyl-acyl-carrier-protein synthase II